MEQPEEKKRKVQDGETTGPEISEEDIKSLLDPLSREQLVELLVRAGSQYSAVAEEIRDVASKDPAHRKLFVRGLAWETTTVTLRDAFAQYGEIDEAAVITDKGTGKSRGFGFITFKHMDSAYRAIKEPSKRIDGRMTVCNLAAAGGGTGGGGGGGGGGPSDVTARKVYVGGLSYDTTSESLLNLFAQYGEIEEGAIAYDKATSRSRGFAFITFKSVDSARRACAEGTRNIEGRQVVVKIAAEGQKEKAAATAAALMMQHQSAVPSAYGYGAAASVMGGGAGYRPAGLPSATPQGLTYGSQMGAYQAGQTAFSAVPLQQQQYQQSAQGAQQYGLAPGGLQQQQQAFSTGAYAGLPGAGTGSAGVSSNSMPLYFTGTS
eukprot:jgi/Mesen1/3601/ME000020S03136